jgi:hypothetical protein
MVAKSSPPEETAVGNTLLPAQAAMSIAVAQETTERHKSLSLIGPSFVGMNGSGFVIKNTYYIP